MKGMFSFLFPPSLSVPANTESLNWELARDDAPPCPPSTLEYDLDPVQELFCDITYQREVEWAKYVHELNQGCQKSLTAKSSQ